MSSSPSSMVESVSAQMNTAQQHNTCRSTTHNAIWCVSHAPAPPTIAEALGIRLSIRLAASDQRFRCSTAIQATPQTVVCACQCRTTMVTCRVSSPATQGAMPHLVSTTATRMPPCNVVTLRMLVSDSSLMYLQATVHASLSLCRHVCQLMIGNVSPRRAMMGRQCGGTLPPIWRLTPTVTGTQLTIGSGLAQVQTRPSTSMPCSEVRQMYDWTHLRSH